MSLTPELLALSDNWCLPFIWIDGKLMFPFIVFPVASLSLFSLRSRVRFSFAVAKLQRFFALCKCSREIFQYLREPPPQTIDSQWNKNMCNNVNLCKHYISQLCCTTESIYSTTKNIHFSYFRREENRTFQPFEWSGTTLFNSQKGVKATWRESGRLLSRWQRGPSRTHVRGPRGW